MKIPFITICFCLGVLASRAQRSGVDYDAKWKRVDSLLHQAGLPESALAAVGKIDTLARQEHNSGQQIKALIYRVTIGLQKNDDEATAIRSVEQAVSQAAQPSRSILESVLAKLYWGYLTQHRGELSRRTATVSVTRRDVATWTMDDLYRQIGELFLASVREERLLGQSPVKEWEPIVIAGDKSKLRPTLYDVLAHEALAYFTSTEASINEPSDVYGIDDSVAFAEMPVFAAHVFSSMDSTSPHYKALLLYQRLLRFHQADAQPDAFVDVDIDRLQFALRFSILWNKDTEYLGALTRLTERWGDKPFVAEAWYLRAKADTNKARAKEICDRVLREPDSSAGKANCRVLLDDIVRPTLNLEVEEFNVPNKPFRCLVSWKNVKRIYVRIAKADSLVRKDRAVTDVWPGWLHAPVVRSFVQDLPDSGDYLTHAAEIAVGSLPAGAYVLLSSTDPDWDVKKAVITGQELYVTSFAYIRENRDYFVVDRETGLPITDARVQLWAKVSDRDGRSWNPVQRGTYHTDRQGHFQLRKRQDYEQQFLEFQRAGEDIYLSGLYSPNIVFGSNVPRTDNKVTYENTNTHVYFFLDRSIYRPGQTMYFKGISITRDYDTRQLKPVAGRKGTVVLYNANGEKIDSVALTTDDFGAYHGSFHLPEHSLNGRFQIDDYIGETFRQSFSVEEYKRPRFQVGFDRLKGSYRVGDSIRVTGSAKAYAGNTLDGAAVKYRITREARYPVYRGYGGYSGHGGYGSYPVGRVFPPSSQEIAHGELKTDANGVFRLAFNALPDRAVPVSADPRFEYRIEADVTDINGETRSGSTTIVAGYTVLNLSIGLEENVSIIADSLRSIRVEVNNLSGEPVASVVHLAAYPLQAPNRLIRERLWVTVPDRWVLAEKAFLDSFPHDQYREELNKQGWLRGAAAWEGLDSTGGQQVPVRLGAGWWEIEATTTDVYGHTVKDIRYIELYDRAGRPAGPEYLWSNAPVTEIASSPGGVVRLETSSSVGDLWMIRQIERPDNDSLEFQPIGAAGGRTVDERPITEADRGGFGVADAFVRDNRVFVHRTLVTVPWDNKELSIQYSSYRDKTEPGSGEKWAVRIGGWRGTRVAAQVLAAMYDASLDQFQSQGWAVPELYPSKQGVTGWNGIDDFGVSWAQAQVNDVPPAQEVFGRYDGLLSIGVSGRMDALNFDVAPYRGNRFMDFGHMKLAAPAARVTAEGKAFYQDADLHAKSVAFDGVQAPGAQVPGEAPPVAVRTNFQETAFFFPDLRTDSAGDVSFSFTMPESLTAWKWMTLAHTRELAFGYSEKTIVTKKQLMVQPNMPRFLREGDKINLSVKVVNLTDSEMTGQMGLALTDPTTGETADGWFVNRQPNQYFTVPAKGSFVVEFPLDIPYQYNRPLSYRVTAQAGAYSDGEEAVLPVVSNRMLVTETLPLNMPGDGVRSFTFGRLLRSGSSETLSHHSLTVEFTANPAWYAVEALPYLIQYPYECAEQTFDRLYANALARQIVSGSPRIAQVFERWRAADTAALLSNLEKDQELKSVLLEETPWVLEGKTETQQKKNVALLFDLSRVSAELGSTVEKLAELQNPDGAFPWFKGGPDDRYVTQYILTGLGRMQQMRVLSTISQGKVITMERAALAYADRKITGDYLEDLKVKGGVHDIGSIPAQYLYMRSMFNDFGIPGSAFPAVNFYRKLAQENWVKASKYLQGMVALALSKTGDGQTARNIVASLRETAIRDEELGMYWKGMEGGYYWYQAPVETESLLIEVFREIAHDTAADRQMKTWLLRQKQTHHWATTKATAEAVYALLTGKENWLDQEREVRVQLGEKTVDLSSGEAGTGYAKKIFDAPFVNPGMGNIKVSMTSARPGVSAAGSGTGSAAARSVGSPAWGAVYWQYFDQLDRITAAGQAKVLRVSKRLFIQRNTNRGPVLDTIPDNGTLHVGDRVVARIVLRADRDLEYVHLKDMRGACLEPLDVLSGYRWQGGLGYYETTKDASTEFFFPSVPRGVYVFDYSLVVGQTGEFSNGLGSVECLYAPEFADHTEGIRINVEGRQ